MKSRLMRILNYNRRDEVMLLKFVENSCNVILLYWFDWRDRHYLPRPHRNPMGGRFYAPFNSLNFSENQKETSWAYWVNSRPLRANTCLSLSFHGNKYTYLFFVLYEKDCQESMEAGRFQQLVLSSVIASRNTSSFAINRFNKHM